MLFVTENVAFWKPALQSSTYFDGRFYSAMFAVDGNMNAGSCTNPESQPWLAVDLESQMDVGLVCVTNDRNELVG